MRQRLLQQRPLLEGTFVPVVAILCIAAVLIIALRGGQEWDGDFALYIMNARNIVLWLPYGKTPYLFDAANAVHPAAYPPGLPLLIAPIYAALGINLAAIKIACVATFVLFLFVFHRISLSVVSPPSALAVTAAFGLHPYILDFENSPSSEFPFMFFCYGALYLLSRLSAETGRPPRSLAPSVAVTALAVAAACLTRPIGGLLFPAAFAVSVLQHRRLVTPENVALCLGAAILLLAQLAFPADIGTYVGFFARLSVHEFLESIQQYFRVAAALLGKAAVVHRGIGIALLMGVASLMLVGFVVQTRRRFSVLEVFSIAYIGFLLVYPLADPSRYSLPIWPLLFLYFAEGVETFGKAFETPFSRRVLKLAVCGTVAAVYAIQYASMTFGEIPFSVEARQSRELFADIERDLPERARLLTRKPAIIALYTGREAVTWPETFSDSELWTYLARMHVNYIVQDLYHLGVNARSKDLLDPFVQRNAARLKLVFSNEWFKVYRAD